MPASPRLPWHRLFGIALVEQFAGTPWRVELELELALRSQRLDIVLIERTPGAAAGAVSSLPDGLDDLRAHNLLTYKSVRESLTVWTLDELLAHYVNYRKLNPVTPSPQPPLARGGGDTACRLHPATDFGLYAVTTRTPHKLAAQVPFQPAAWPGVYDLAWGARRIRVIVLNEIEPHPRNASWELFSADLDRIRHGLAHYQPTDAAAQRLLYQLYFTHRLEFPDMAYTMQDFIRDTDRLFIENLTPEQFREAAAHLTPEQCREVIAHLPPEERLRGLPPEDVLRGLSPEERLRLRDLLNRPN